jgi:hypothetical protein
MASWAPIGVADALELLSPDYGNEEVGEAGGAEDQQAPWPAAVLNVQASRMVSGYFLLGLFVCRCVGTP